MANRSTKDIRVLPIVIPELKLGHIERHVFSADLVESADDTAFEDRPEAFNRIRVNRADDVFASGVVDDAKRIILGEASIAGPLIRAEQAHFVRDDFVDEAGESRGTDVLNHATDGIALAANSANNGRLAGTDTASPATAATLVPMPVLGKTAHEGLIDFDNAAELLKFLSGKRGPDPMGHIPSGFVRPKPHVAIDLKRAHSLLAGEHQVNDFEPRAQRLIRVFKDRSGDMREAITALRGALVALPVPGVALQLRRVLSAAARAPDAFGPFLSDKIGATGFLVGKGLIELRRRQLVNGLFGRHSCRSPVE